MVSNQLDMGNVQNEIKAIYQNTGSFVNDEGRTIEYENYTVIIELDGTRVKAKLDKAFNEIMKDIVNENNLLNI